MPILTERGYFTSGRLTERGRLVFTKQTEQGQAVFTGVPSEPAVGIDVSYTLSTQQNIYQASSLTIPTTQRLHTTRTNAYALSHNYYISTSSTHALGQILFALRSDNLLLNQIIPMDRVWGYPLSLRIVDPPDKRVTIVYLVVDMESMDLTLIANKEVDDANLFAQKDTDVVMAVRMLPLS